MGSVTCERCGFVSFATSEVCKQCGGTLPGPQAARNWLPPQPQPAWQQQGGADWQQQQQSYAPNWPPPPPQGWPPPPPYGNSAHYSAGPSHHAADDGLPKRKGMAVFAMLCGLLALPVMIGGALAAIPLGAPAAILGAVVGLVMMILALVLGIVGTVRVNRNPFEFGGKGMAVAGIVLGSLLLVGIVPMAGIISAIAIPNLLAARRASNEAATVGALRNINSAQATYLSTAGANTSYGTMDELIKNDLLGRNMAEGTYCGYRYELTVSGDSYELTAVPIKYPQTARRSFFTDESGVIRAADKQGEPADENDPAFDAYDDGLPSARGGEPEVDWSDHDSMQRHAASRLGRR